MKTNEELQQDVKYLDAIAISRQLEILALNKEINILKKTIDMSKEQLLVEIAKKQKANEVLNYQLNKEKDKTNLWFGVVVTSYVVSFVLLTLLIFK